MNVYRSACPRACARRLAAAVALAGLFGGGPLAASALAAPMQLPDGIYPYSVLDQDVTAVLREFGQNLGLRVKLSPKVSGTVKGKLPRLPALEFLNHVCQMYGLEWYYDGATLHISSVSEETTRFLPLHKGRIASRADREPQEPFILRRTLSHPDRRRQCLGHCYRAACLCRTHRANIAHAGWRAKTNDNLPGRKCDHREIWLRSWTVGAV